jgi:hypothetical protein
VSAGVRSLLVDGHEVAGSLVPVAPAGTTVRVEVVLGS